LRIDSGGGSAQASELIWRALAEMVAVKPVVVSMSDVAASGGYYIASGATKIFALDDTITGSIGVIGGHIAPAAALAKLGINTFPTGRGKRATMFASLGPWTDDEREAIKKTMEAVYDTFIGRVADGRHKAKDVIEKIAAGRAWTGAAGKDLGLVDQIGGLDDALAEAKQLAKVDATSELEVYPPDATLRDFIVGFGQGGGPFGVSFGSVASEELRAMSPEIADTAGELLRLVESFRTTTIQAVTIVPELR
jgi:protease-4